MCTVSWRLGPSGAGSFRAQEPGAAQPHRELFCNRDELRQRPQAQPPRLHRRRNVSFLAPVDTQAGGTWVAVSELGLALTLLNGYRDGDMPTQGPFESRGTLVMDLAPCASLDEIQGRLSELDLMRFRSFVLLVLPPDRDPTVFRWFGKSLEKAPAQAPLASSSRDATGAQDARRSLWLEEAPRASKSFLELHRSHRPSRGPYSPCMHREDAATVSFTHVGVWPERVAMAYADGPPCRTSLGTPIDLPRRPRG